MKTSNKTWFLLAFLLLLSVVPIAGSIHSFWLLLVGRSAPRFVNAPAPIVLHILTMCPFMLLGAFQFVERFRRTKTHARLGRFLVPAALIAALSGLHMTLFYPRAPLDGNLIFVARLFTSVAMLTFVVVAVFALFQRDYRKHGDFMMRAYALTMGAGTQVLTNVPLVLVEGWHTEKSRGIAMAGAWVINMLVVEWVIAKRPSKS